MRCLRLRCPASQVMPSGHTYAPAFRVMQPACRQRWRAATTTPLLRWKTGAFVVCEPTFHPRHIRARPIRASLFPKRLTRSWFLPRLCERMSTRDGGVVCADPFVGKLRRRWPAVNEKMQKLHARRVTSPNHLSFGSRYSANSCFICSFFRTDASARKRHGTFRAPKEPHPTLPKSSIRHSTSGAGCILLLRTIHRGAHRS